MNGPRSIGHRDPAEELVVRPAPFWRVALDGEPGHRFSPGGKVEVWLVATPYTKSANAANELHPRLSSQRQVMLALEFDSYEQADAARPELVKFADVANVALEHVWAIVKETPKRQLHDGHRHKIRLERFSRTLPLSATCELCMETLTEDTRTLLVDPAVVEHTRDAGINDDGGLTQTGVKVLEAWFNGPGRPRPDDTLPSPE